MEQVQVEEQNTASVSGAIIKQFLTFNVSSDRYAVEISHIKEILEINKITQVPMCSEYISGVVNLRGNVVPVINLAKRFDSQPMPITKRSSIILLEVKDQDEILEIGIVVDFVNEVLDISELEIENTPSFGTKIRTEFIEGMAKVKGELLVLLDVDRVLLIDELSVVN